MNIALIYMLTFSFRNPHILVVEYKGHIVTHMYTRKRYYTKMPSNTLPPTENRYFVYYINIKHKIKQ